MKLLVNATNLRSGGGLQKTFQFIHNANKFGIEHYWNFLLSRQVAEVLKLPPKNDIYQITIFDDSPARILAGTDTRKKLNNIEKTFKPDAVYTIYGPAYYNFSSPHLMGFAVPWVTHPSDLAWLAIKGIVKRIRFTLWCQYVAFWARFADEWEIETHTAADGLARRIGKPKHLIHVIPNSCGSHYYTARDSLASKDLFFENRPKDEFRLLSFTAWYPHKNLEIIPSVASKLKKLKPEKRFCFILTINKESEPWMSIRKDSIRLGVNDMILNIGPIPVIDGPKLYKSCHALFLPTLLETFTATYPEAMCMRRPIITSDLDFARDICGDAAIYFRPMDSHSAAVAIIDIASNDDLVEKINHAGEERLRMFGSPEERFRRYLSVLENMVEH